MEKNHKIRFYKVVFTFIIALYHLLNIYNRNTSWYIAVEFFFYTSGYLIANSFENNMSANGNKNALTFTWQRFKNFFPYALFSFFVAFIAKGIYGHYTFTDYIRGFFSHLSEVFLIHSCGLGHGADYYFNSVTWYISVLLILGYVIWFFLETNKSLFIKIIAPLSVLLFYSYLYRTYGHLNEHYETVGFVLNSALLRGGAGLSTGVLIYYLSKRDTIKSRWFFGFVSDFCFLTVIVLATLCSRSSWDYLFAALLAVGVFFSFASGNQIPFKKVYDNKIVIFLSNISLSIYLNHKVFRSVFKLLFPKDSISVYIVYILFIIVYSTVTYYVLTGIIRIIKNSSLKCFKAPHSN